MKINKIFYKIKFLNIPKIRKKLIVYTSFLVLFLVAINFALFYVSEKNSYILQMEISNEKLAKQIGFSYEMVIKNVKNSVYKTALKDMELIKLVQNYDGSFDYKNNIFDKLYNIILANEYIDSAYIYIPRFNQVFSTSNNLEKISYFSTFSDKAVFEMLENKNYFTLGPRTIETEYSRSKKQVYSIVSPVPLNSEQKPAFLVVNIDLDRLRYNILVKLKRNDNMYFYVVDDKNTIIITERNSSGLGTIVENKLYNTVSYKGLLGNILSDNITIRSIYNSESLKWNFVLQTSVDIKSSVSYAGTLIWFAIASIMMLIVSLVIIPIFTRPIHKVLLNYNEKLWKDFITDNINLTDEIKEQLLNDEFKIRDGKFGVITLYVEQKAVSDKTLSYYKSALKNIIDFHIEGSGAKAKLIVTGKKSFTVLIHYMDVQSAKFCDEQHSRFAKMIYDGIDKIHSDKVYLAVSSIKEHFSSIPSLYRECMDMLQYRLASDTRLLHFSALEDKKEFYEYPDHLEKQLINNLSIGNFEACRSIMDEFFQLFSKPNIRIKDDEIINSIYHLINSALKSIANIPGVMQDTSNINISNMDSLDEMKVYIVNIIEGICEKIIEKSNDEKSKSYDKIFDYIDKNYTLPDISVNKIADDLGLNRGFVSKVINETTGNSFTDYINGKRIALSKILLRDKNKTIKDIAKEVGYNYSYYFIKIFKNIEGITPGQYRNSTDL